MRRLRYGCAIGALMGMAGCAEDMNAPAQDLPDELRQWTWEEATECKGGCTLTQGYWKNHNKYAKNDSQRIPWPQMIRPGDENGEDNEFCGITWLELLQMEPSGGDAYLILAHQWIAARLSVAGDNGPDACHPPLVTWALTRGEELLEGCIIDEADRDRALRLAGWLEKFNEGEIGPGHCDDKCDDGSSDDHDSGYHDYGGYGEDWDDRKHGECEDDHDSRDGGSKDCDSRDGYCDDHDSWDGGSKDCDSRDGYCDDHDSWDGDSRDKHRYDAWD